ncbi:hypothetical protein [Nocardia nova]|uniref:hypothetical protein n=1 Tax=Nocardia nova TaxID=37330 RepID=UPI0015E3BAB3|nr:hypothetical protein [Nocardia nova]
MAGFPSAFNWAARAGGARGTGQFGQPLVSAPYATARQDLSELLSKMIAALRFSTQPA